MPLGHSHLRMEHSSSFWKGAHTSSRFQLISRTSSSFLGLGFYPGAARATDCQLRPFPIRPMVTQDSGNGNPPGTR